MSSQSIQHTTIPTNNYRAVFTVNKPVNEVIEEICHVNKWWSRHIEGETGKTGDTYTIYFGATYVTFYITEVSANKVEWRVTDCMLPWLKNRQEWINTIVCFTVSTDGNCATVDFMHVGLNANMECYESCEKGWNFYFGQSLYKLLAEGKGMPDTPAAERARG